MEVPDISGYMLQEALIVLQRYDIDVCSITATAPPRGKGIEIGEDCRIVRVKIADDKKVELLVCKPL